ncbi:RnfABCDGE type electron transport complex subunit B, partial [Thauera aminoaromatica]
QAAAAVAAGDAPVTLCPPGGRAVAEKLAQILGATFDPGNLPDRGPLLARVRTDACIGCSRCIKSCPTDAILGATKQLHVVLEEACIGCGACAEVCPTGGIDLEGIPVTLRNWRWHKPGVGHA